MNIIKPPYTGDPTLDSWTNQITQALNMGLLLPGIQGQTGGVGSAGPTGNTAIYLYQRTTVNTAPSRPTTVVYDYTDIDNVTITANNGWLGEVPTTGGKYLWITFRYVSNLEDTITNANTWNTVVLLSEDGNDGAPAPRSLYRRVYYSSSSGAPSSPTATVTWATLVLSGLTTGWSETAPTASATSTTLVYFSDLIFTDDTGVATTGSSTGSTPIEGTSFSGIVTFNSGSFSLDGSTITSIDGGNISTGTITSNEIATGTITANQIATGTITAASGVIGSLSATDITTGTITIARLPGIGVAGSTTVNSNTSTTANITVSFSGVNVGSSMMAVITGTFGQSTASTVLTITPTGSGVTLAHTQTTGGFVVENASAVNGTPYTHVITATATASSGTLGFTLSKNNSGNLYYKVANSLLTFKA
jgi:hypothetical protein|tara:strand:- start:505 stop:1764 length:1260 start_codon:yes stop_codon:yes gene_type:complete